MKHDTAGDPMTGVKWTRRTTEKIAGELRAASIEVCATTVARLLNSLGYRLRVNHKKLPRRSDPDRDAQFAYITTQRETFARKGLPIISIDSKKRELVGNSRSQAPPEAGSRPSSTTTTSAPTRRASPYGVYDLTANHGCLFVGTSHDTPDFAVDNLVRWWNYHGRRRYPGATELLVLTDGGGSNGVRTRAWKHALQQRVCDRHRLTVTVCHYPTGASKWNPIEHRMSSEISKNWAGKAPRQLPDDHQLRADDAHQIRLAHQRLPGQHPILDRFQNQRRRHGAVTAASPRNPTDPQLHPQPTVTPQQPRELQTWKLFLTEPLAAIRALPSLPQCP